MRAAAAADPEGFRAPGRAARRQAPEPTRHSDVQMIGEGPDAGTVSLVFGSPPVRAALAGATPSGSVLADSSGERSGGGGASARNGRPRSLTLRLEPDVDAAGKAREALERLHDEVEPELLGDMHLLVTELVTNSVRHSGAAPDQPVQVEVSVDGDRVFVAVEDAGEGFEPSPRSASSPRDSGWGLHLVERLSCRWGVRRNGRTRVWLELARGRRAEPVT